MEKSCISCDSYFQPSFEPPVSCIECLFSKEDLPLYKRKSKEALDRNGYAPSIIQDDTSFCYACGKRTGKLDRHEPFGGAYRDKSKALGLWIVLCHTPCHQGRTGAHGDPAVNEEYRKEAQRRAMEAYGWSTADFIKEFGKNHL